MCGYNFVRGDQRSTHTTEVKNALCLLLYSLGTSSFGFLAKLLGVSRTTTDYWRRDMAETIDEPTIPADIHAIEFDKM
jgi:transposase-like protein